VRRACRHTGDSRMSYVQEKEEDDMDLMNLVLDGWQRFMMGDIWHMTLAGIL